jgi:hypothetical protein
MRPLVPSDNIPQPAFTPGYKVRSKQDPPAMSAMFVALTVVCVLGASAVMTTAGRDGGEGLAGVASSVLASIGFGSEANAGSDTLAREIGTSNVNVEYLGTIVRDNIRSSNQEFARVYQEITTLKSEVSTLREHSEPTWTSAKVDDLRDKVSTLRSNMSLLASSLDEISIGRDSETDRINRRLAKIEDVISIQPDITASIPRQTFPPMPRKRAPRTSGWTAQDLGNGIYSVSGPTGKYDVTIGSYVPGLGRIEAIKNQGGRLHLVTGKDRAQAPATE